MQCLPMQARLDFIRVAFRMEVSSSVRGRPRRPRLLARWGIRGVIYISSSSSTIVLRVPEAPSCPLNTTILTPCTQTDRTVRTVSSSSS